MSEFTTAQIEAGILEALGAANMQAVVELLHLLAAQEPGRAQLYLHAIELGGVTK